MKVSNIIGNNRNAVKNQFVIENKKTLTFQSYELTICCFMVDTDILVVNNNWDCSSTTLKYFKLFLKNYCCFSDEVIKQVQDFLKSDNTNDIKDIAKYTIIKIF